MKALDVGIRAGYTTNGYISYILRREKPIPLDRLSDIAKGLKLHGADRDEFALLAQLSVCPRFIQDQYWAMRDRLDALEKAGSARGRRIDRMEEVMGQLAALKEENARLKRASGEG